MQLPELNGPENGLLGWLKWAAIVGPLFLSAYVLWRSKTTSYWKEERDAAVAQATRVKEENAGLKEKLAGQEKELAECRAKTDLSILMEQHRMFHVELLGALTTVASGSDGRYERALLALERNAANAENIQASIVSRLDNQTVALQMITTTLERVEERLNHPG